jgi:hypothetical protein
MYVGALPPFVGEAVKVTGDPWQNGLAEATIETPAGNSLLVAIVIALESTVRLPLTQTALEVSWHIITSPETAVNINVELFDPTFIPFNFHKYTGKAPPLVGVAVKVTCVPKQEGLVNVETVTPTGRTGRTLMVIELDVTGLVIGQGTLDVSTQVTISPLFG